MKNRIVVLLIGLILTNSCVNEKTDNRCLKIINLSNHEIYWLRCYNGVLEEPYLNDDIDTVQTDSCSFLYSFRPNWEDVINDSKNKKIYLYIIAKDSIEKYGWKYIYKEQIFNRKYMIDIDFLEKQKWTIVYR